MHIMTLRAGLRKRVHVYGQRIRSYSKTEALVPCYIIKYRGETFHAWQVDFKGAVTGCQDLENGMPGCRHAKVWLETTGEVTLHMRRP